MESIRIERPVRSFREIPYWLKAKPAMVVNASTRLLNTIRSQKGQGCFSSGSKMLQWSAIPSHGQVHPQLNINPQSGVITTRIPSSVIENLIPVFLSAIRMDFRKRNP